MKKQRDRYFQLFDIDVICLLTFKHNHSRYQDLARARARVRACVCVFTFLL